MKDPLRITPAQGKIKVGDTLTWHQNGKLVTTKVVKTTRKRKSGKVHTAQD